jgi:hypothetical protein
MCFIRKVNGILCTGLCDIGMWNVDCCCENERERERVTGVMCGVIGGV